MPPTPPPPDADGGGRGRHRRSGYAGRPLSALNLQQLREACRLHDVPARGNKQALAAALIPYLRSEWELEKKWKNGTVEQKREVRALKLCESWVDAFEKKMSEDDSELSLAVLQSQHRCSVLEDVEALQETLVDRLDVEWPALVEKVVKKCKKISSLDTEGILERVRQHYPTLEERVRCVEEKIQFLHTMQRLREAVSGATAAAVVHREQLEQLRDCPPVLAKQAADSAWKEWISTKNKELEPMVAFLIKVSPLAYPAARGMVDAVGDQYNELKLRAERFGIRDAVLRVKDAEEKAVALGKAVKEAVQQGARIDHSSSSSSSSPAAAAALRARRCTNDRLAAALEQHVTEIEQAKAALRAVSSVASEEPAENAMRRMEEARSIVKSRRRSYEKEERIMKEAMRHSHG